LVELSRIETAGPDMKARRLCFSDGTFRLTAARVVKSLDLTEGVAVDPEALEGLLAPVEATTARERAVQLLGYRDRTYAELERKLRDDGYPQQLATATADWLRDSAFIDDERFAHSYVRMRGASGYGRSRIARELEQKGIDRETARMALEECDLPPDSERARHVLHGSAPHDRKSRDRCLRRLIARGYSFTDAMAALDGKDEPEPR
jgi:regulatory protein